MQKQIIEEAEEYIHAFYEKRKLNIETNKINNREREKVFKIFLRDSFCYTLCLFEPVQ